MRKPSNAFTLVLFLGVFALTFLFRSVYEDAFKAWVIQRIARAGYSDMAATFMSGLAELIPALTLAFVIVYGLHWYIRREYQTASDGEPSPVSVLDIAPTVAPDGPASPPMPSVSAWDSAIAELRNRYIDRPVEIDDDKGFLDYSADGLQALQDITTLVNASGAETDQLTAFMAKVTASGPSADLVRRRDEVTELADFMNGYSVKTEEMASLVKAITSSMQENQMKIVEQSNVTSDQDREAMQTYMNSMRANAESSGAAGKMIAQFRETMDGLKGISRALNRAIAKLSPILRVLSKEFERYQSVTAALATLCSQKLAAAEKK